MMTGQGNNRMPPLLVVVSKSLENLVLKKRRLLEDRNRSSLQKNLVVLNQVRDLLLLRHQLVAVSQSKISNS